MAELLVLVLGIVLAAGAFVKGGPVQLLKKILKGTLRLTFRAIIGVARLKLRNRAGLARS